MLRNFGEKGKKEIFKLYLKLWNYWCVYRKFYGSFFSIVFFKSYFVLVCKVFYSCLF